MVLESQGYPTRYQNKTQTSGRVPSVKRTAVRRLFANARNAFNPLSRSLASGDEGVDASEQSRSRPLRRLLRKKLQRVSGHGSTYLDAAPGVPSGLKSYEKNAHIRKAILAALRKGEAVEIPQVVLPSIGAVNTVIKEDGTTAPDDKTRPSTPEPEPERYHVEDPGNPSQGDEPPATTVEAQAEPVPSNTSRTGVPLSPNARSNDESKLVESPGAELASGVVGSVDKPFSNNSGATVLAQEQSDQSEPPQSPVKAIRVPDCVEDRFQGQKVAYPTSVPTYQEFSTHPILTSAVHHINVEKSSNYHCYPDATFESLHPSNYHHQESPAPHVSVETSSNNHCWPDATLGSLHPSNYNPQVPVVAGPVHPQSPNNLSELYYGEPMDDIQPSYSYPAADFKDMSDSLMDTSNSLGYNQAYPSPPVEVPFNNAHHVTPFSPADLFAQPYLVQTSPPINTSLYQHFMPQPLPQFCAPIYPGSFQHEATLPASYMNNQWAISQPVEQTHWQPSKPEDSYAATLERAEMFKRKRSEPPSVVPSSITLCDRSDWVRSCRSNPVGANVNVHRSFFGATRHPDEFEVKRKRQKRRTYGLIDPKEFIYHSQHNRDETMLDIDIADPVVAPNWSSVISKYCYMEGVGYTETNEGFRFEESSSTSGDSYMSLAGDPSDWSISEDDSMEYVMSIEDIGPRPMDSVISLSPCLSNTNWARPFATGLWAWFVTALWALWALLVAQTRTQSPSREHRW